jgi:hypothetical protein
MLKNGRSVAPNTVLSEEEQRSVREQLEKMLASPLFKNSKRFPALWRFVVEQTLEGHGAELKERTLGVHVFGRDPDYDTNADPIVRVTAGEIRKRIAQYYDEEEHRSEIRIHLSPGSYIPEFEFPVDHVEEPAETGGSNRDARMRSTGSWWNSPAAVMVLAATTILSLSALGFTILKSQPVRTSLDRFWDPVINAPDPVLVCMGQRTFLANAQEPQQPPNPDFVGKPEPPPGGDKQILLLDLYHLGSQNVTLPDSQTLGRIIGLLNVRGKRYKVIGEHFTSLADLRAGPSVLVGAYNNDWTLRLTSSMPFTFEREGTKRWIGDKRNPSRRDYLVDYATPYLTLDEDYAIVARVQEPTTDRNMVIVAGLAGYGTVAGGEFIADSSYMEAAIKKFKVTMDRKNVAWVIATKVINGNSGPPRVADYYAW